MTTGKGFTLVELAVAMAVFALAFSLLFVLLEESSQSLAYFSSTGIIDSVIMRSLDAITDDVRQSADLLPTGVPGRIVIVPGTHDDRLFVVYAENVTDITRVEYGVDGARRLARTTTRYVLDASGAPVRKTDGAGNVMPPDTRILALNVDRTDNSGQKGFAVSQAAGVELYTVALRLRAEGDAGELLRRGFATAASIRS